MHFSHHEGRRCGGRGFGFGRGFGGGFASGRGARHGGGFGGPFGGRGEGGGRRKRFDADSLRLVVLKLVSEEPRHGYDVIRAIETMTGGTYAPSPGVIYPTLSLLAEMGLIAESAEDKSRRSFAITADGEAYLVVHGEAADAAVARLKALAAPAGGLDPSPIRRAVQHLGAVLEAKLAEEGTDKARLLDIAALVDEAASKIERL